MKPNLVSCIGVILIVLFCNCYTQAQSFSTVASLQSDEPIVLSQGENDKTLFPFDSPTISSTNPSSCFGTSGSITIGGLTPGGVYQLSYTDSGVPVGPISFMASSSGEIIITGLNAGLYANFSLLFNSITTNLFTGVILSDPIFVPTFAPVPPFCAGTTAPVLPPTSINGLTGTWSPSVVSNQSTGNYTFTPAPGQCGTPFTITIIVIPNVVPAFSFGTSLTICSGGTVPSLPSTSTNGITGTWSPSVVDNQNSGTYTFTPTAGSCATTTTLTVTVNPNITPTFSFGSSLTICAGEALPTLPPTSTNGITGTWSPAVADNQNSGTYTFTPTTGLCATAFTFSVTVNPNSIPTFSFGASLTICTGGTVPTLPSTSSNGISGTWNPAVVNNQNSGTYTFTPTIGLCAIPFTLTVTVSPTITPTFPFGNSLTTCAGGIVPALPGTSTNGITGTWSPSVVDNLNSGIYIFTPTAGSCATASTFTVTVNPNLTPVFNFGTSLTICAGTAGPVLPGTSSNGITGTWSPAIVDNQNSGVYTFTPNTGQCVLPGAITLTVTVTPNILPAFSFGNSLSICAGDAVPVLPTTSTNGITGTWNPSVVSNQSGGTYVFSAGAGQCVTPFTFTVTVNPVVTAAFSFGTFQSICIGTTVPVLTTTSSNGITGTWSPSVIDNLTNGTYTFTPAGGQCANGTTFTLEVNPVPSTTIRTDTTVYDGAILPEFNFVHTPGAVVNWVNSNSSIGLTESGSGTVPSFIAVNNSDDTAFAIITAVPAINGCSGTAQSYVITVLPLDKNVFVPNVFSPNHDGKNDVLFIYGNYIDKVEMHIYNQWGQKIAMINNKTQGWNGTDKGNPQPVGVYVYVLKAVLVSGKTVNLKGSITLVR